MKSKLTLSIDKELVQYARRQARLEGRSISGMFSIFLQKRKSREQDRAVSQVSDMIGSLAGYYIDDSKQAIRAAYAKKYTD